MLGAQPLVYCILCSSNYDCPSYAPSCSQYKQYILYSREDVPQAMIVLAMHHPVVNGDTVNLLLQMVGNYY